MKTLLLLAAALTLALAACGETSKPTLAAAPEKPVAAPKPDPDKELATRVKKALQQEARIPAAAIDVSAADGAVTLWGTATSADEHRRVAQIAAKVQGVKSVENKLEIVTGS